MKTAITTDTSTAADFSNAEIEAAVQALDAVKKALEGKAMK